MARYIDADELLKKNMYGNTSSIAYRTYTENLIKNAPTADVAPKSEVAREIFEEITNSLLSLVYLGPDGKWHTQKKYASKLHSFVEDYLNLKEKYIKE